MGASRNKLLDVSVCIGEAPDKEHNFYEAVQCTNDFTQESH